ncbi:MAG: peptidylprolyl isomerase [Clostridia bacterium]|nr:peptidylprolyl isomerase [Clostridia bacterium]
MENNKKTQAELYREERKERLAKAAEKSAKKAPKTMKAKKLAKKIIAIVLAVVVGLGAVYGVLSFFDVPEKVIKVSIDNADNTKTYKFSVGEYNYYYFTTWLSFYQQAAQYEQYMGTGAGLMYTGFDYSKAPSDQEFTEDTAKMLGVTMEELGNPKNPTWDDAIKFAAVNNIVSVKYGSDMAKENNLTLTDEEKKDIESNITQLEETAHKSDYSVNRWLRAQYGKGVTEKVVRQVLEENYLSSKYFEHVSNKITEAVTDANINEEYNKDKDAFDLVDIRLYSFKTTIKETDHKDLSDEEHEKLHEEEYAKTKKLADEFLASVKDEDSFIAAAKRAILTADNKSTKDPDETTLVEKTTKASLTSSSEELAKWVYDDARQVGDVTVIDGGEGTYYVVMIKTLPYQDLSFASANVRHILVKFPTDSSTGKTTIKDEEKPTYKAKAQKILDDFLANEPTEDKFAALVKEKTEDTGSKSTGGLYENVADDGQYVQSFVDWTVDASRKPGDTGIIETEYGYHIMYFVKANEGLKWQTDVKAKIVSDQYNAQVNEVIENETKNIKLDTALLNYMTKNIEKTIKKLIVANS